MPVPLADPAADDTGHTPLSLRLFQAVTLVIVVMAAIVSIAMIGTGHDGGRPAVHSTASPPDDLFSGMPLP
jgi:hypothetical protein